RRAKKQARPMLVVWASTIRCDRDAADCTSPVIPDSRPLGERMKVLFARILDPAQYATARGIHGATRQFAVTLSMERLFARLQVLLRHGGPRRLRFGRRSSPQARGHRRTATRRDLPTHQ